MAISIPIRSNGETIVASWFNSIRSALFGVLSPNVVVQTQFTIADNQASSQSITGLSFDSTLVRGATIFYLIYRTNGTSIERSEVGYLTVSYKPIANAWAWDRMAAGDHALNTPDALTISSGGQVQYRSDSVGGTYSGFIRYKVIEVIDA